MKTISDYLSWPMTEDIEEVLMNLSWEKKFELAIALSQRASDEKNISDMCQRQSEEAQDEIQSLNLIASPAPGPIALGASGAIDGVEFEI
jgi:hypothetical protein